MGGRLFRFLVDFLVESLVDSLVFFLVHFLVAGLTDMAAQNSNQRWESLLTTFLLAVAHLEIHVVGIAQTLLVSPLLLPQLQRLFGLDLFHAVGHVLTGLSPQVLDFHLIGAELLFVYAGRFANVLQDFRCLVQVPVELVQVFVNRKSHGLSPLARHVFPRHTNPLARLRVHFWEVGSSAPGRRIRCIRKRS